MQFLININFITNLRRKPHGCLRYRSVQRWCWLISHIFWNNFWNIAKPKRVKVLFIKYSNRKRTTYDDWMNDCQIPAKKRINSNANIVVYKCKYSLADELSARIWIVCTMAMTRLHHLHSAFRADTIFL